ncbi:phosphoglucosamine mutase [Paraburkholderia xenovorans LB400]|jgi:phosphoglucosamine mutase|uniref:Phosphoglucosamine mutase n=2 Tax=Paraburkholderia TaxID=1822464 RepID=GLMM_PARXL|nr:MULTISPECIES: phosphoglucosamine mutase [Paraburkholderia]Q13W50.1 RecName: Full=Phosphoglucosamine mutase [Paraburkholderia xenovorans LB400]ABE31689.1 phosphoglucosamine mutase [Paraburkholderia xenovorans LB400]AIP30941.1 phosphoglucosamine mutase [Paraburkholderia xenovorans LB400]MDR8399236.1 phosphoglucosamine mutase [Paraburkholderia sp. USG1]NPT36586.1 phosphoglucosamine mutase [Paraburkholderia xenovorans]VVD29616.1 phosphoglucosamine mutase [Paraburkholderia dioscoreae]
MARRYFGTDGIRGKVGEGPITPEFVLRLGYAAGKVLAGADRWAKTGTRPTVLIGKDTRVSGYMLEAALEAGFSAAGVDVMLAGPMPTPGIAYLTRALRLAAGVVISASHNPYYDNGIKFFSADGNKLPDEVEAQIEEQLDQPLACAASEQLGKARRLDDAAGRYIEFCKSTFPAAFDLRGLKLVVDCAHGAAYDVAPHVFHELGADVIPIGVAPNGFNINDGVGATAPDALVRAVRANHADLGIALDGDADRLQVVDAAGRLYNGDELLYILVKDRIATEGKVEGAVGTLMTNMAVEVALQEAGVKFVRAAVGDRYVLEQLREHGWQLGAEGSGHILSLDRHSTGDGIVSALLVLAAMKRSDKTLAELLGGVTLFPQKLINVRMKPDADWKGSDVIRRAIAKAEDALNGRGRVLIRASGTEPVLRVMVEAENVADAVQYAESIASAVKQATA